MLSVAYTTLVQGICEILPVNELYKFAIGSFMYKQINHLFPKMIDNVMFDHSEMHNYNTSAHAAHTIYTRTKKNSK